MPTVDISFAALPAHVRTARLIAVAVARRARVPEEFLDELRLAVGEACSRAVQLHHDHAPAELVRMSLSDDDGRFTVEVVDVGPSDHFPPALDALSNSLQRMPPPRDTGDTVRDLLPPGFGLAVIAGLVEDVEVTPGQPAGTRVRMSWPAGKQADDSLVAAGG